MQVDDIRRKVEALEERERKQRAREGYRRRHEGRRRERSIPPEGAEAERRAADRGRRALLDELRLEQARDSVVRALARRLRAVDYRLRPAQEEFKEELTLADRSGVDLERVYIKELEHAREAARYWGERRREIEARAEELGINGRRLREAVEDEIALETERAERRGEG